MKAELLLDILDQLIGDKTGTFDVPCPLCGPDRRHPVNRRREVMRVWRHAPGFRSYHCVRCGVSGYSSRDDVAGRVDPVVLARVDAELGERDRQYAIKQRHKAIWLWQHRQPIAGSIVETYLRDARRCHGQFPATLGFLPSRRQHPPAMVAAFGLADEPAPGAIKIADEAVRGVHITKLKSDGSDKADTKPNKIMVGRTIGMPIALCPVNDLLGLLISEGIEDALSAREATGLGAWAAGAASRLPALAEAIPNYVESLSILVDDDYAGRQHAAELARRAASRGVETRQLHLGDMWRNAA